MYKKLKDFRAKYNYSTKQMADFLGISKPFYSQVENGLRRLSYDMAVRISLLFKVKPDEIFYNDHVKEKKY